MTKPTTLTDEDYQALAAFRTDLRRFLRFSEATARSMGLTPQQHQALLVIRGHPGPGAPSVTDVADALFLKRHSATELLSRAEDAGLITRTTDADDARRTLCALTDQGHHLLAELSGRHRTELRGLRAALETLGALDTDRSSSHHGEGD